MRYTKIEKQRFFGESYNELISRLADLAETSNQSHYLNQELKND